MNITNELADAVVLCELGERVAAMRINVRLTQEELARRAGVSKRSIERLEKGEGGVRIQILIAVARVLRQLDRLDMFIPEVEMSPYDIVSKKAVPAKRVRARKRPLQPFAWGE